MSKYKIGDLVRFKDDKLEVYSDKFVTLNFDLSDALGKVTGTIDMGPDGIFYHVDVKLNGMTLNLRMKEDQLLSPLEYLNKKVSECFSKRILPTFNPDRNSWMKDLIEKIGKEKYVLKIDLGHYYSPLPKEDKNPLQDALDALRVREKMAVPCIWPFTNDIIEDMEKKLQENARRFYMGIDLGGPAPAPVHSDKMSKEKCVKLLESYVAERAKVKSGRKFERCLRDSVVDDALARAIELLKEKQ